MLPRAQFKRQDVDLLRAVLAGEKYDNIADEQKMGLSTIKRRVKAMFEYVNVPDRSTFMALYEDHTVELGMIVPSEAPETESGTIIQFPTPDSQA
jgi:DNA-binding NarL/FixJ family response regulator